MVHFSAPALVSKAVRDVSSRAITSVIEPGRSSGRLAIIFW